MNDKIPPYSEPVERNVLGAMLIDPKAAEIAMDELCKADLYLPAHRTLFIVFCELFKEYENLDEAFVVSQLSQRGILDSIGGRDYVAKLIIDVPSAAGIESWCNELKTWTEKREIFNLVVTLPERGDIDNQLEIINSAVDRIYNRRLNIESTPQDLHSLAIPIANEALTESPRDFWGLQTGIGQGAFDELTGGIQAGQYWIIAGRTSMGKSTLIREIACGCSRLNPMEGKPLIISTELDSYGIARSALASAAGVAQETILKRKLGESQMERIKRVITNKELEGVMVLFEPYLTVQKLEAIAKRHKNKYGLPVLIIDLAGHIREVEGSNEYEKLKAISRALVSLKGSLNTCLIACVQVSRASIMNKDKRPELENLKGCGSWEEDSGRVLFIHRPYIVDNNTKTEIIQAKDTKTNRLGSVFLKYCLGEGRYYRAQGE